MRLLQTKSVYVFSMASALMAKKLDSCLTVKERVALEVGCY